MITRELLGTGAYLDSFRSLPGLPCWSVQQINESMEEALAVRPPDVPVWLFAYGSLIWNPAIDFAERQQAVLHGWHRSFCIRLMAGRAEPEHPGRMLALDKGGQTGGIAFRLPEDRLREELGLVWVREMVHGLYRPVWGAMRLASGQQMPCLTFVANTEHEQYDDDAGVQSAAPFIAQAQGHLGSNREYLLKLESALAVHGITDRYVDELADAVRALPPRAIDDWKAAPAADAQDETAKYLG